VSPEKGLDRAIAIARQAGMKLKIAAKIYPEERAYFEKTIAPLLRESRSWVEYIGEVGGADKDRFLGNACALLFPIDWPEPFGLVMIEAMACGTPVIAWPNGSVPEVVDDGVTGFIVDTLDDAVQAVERVGTLSRLACRNRFEARFDARRMVRDHLDLYRRLVQSGAETTCSTARNFAPRLGAMASGGGSANANGTARGGVLSTVA
jgi:glycosyltransferase involved in cell wall biosynthesis